MIYPVRLRSGIVLILLMAAAMVQACSTPVFRYAIERWEADPYRLMVFTDGELTAEQQNVVKEFEQIQRYGFRLSPLLVEQYDISTVSNLPATVWTELSAIRAAPCVALLYPSVMRRNEVVWSDDLTTNALNRIVMSPARLETAQRLLGGDAAVWFLVNGPDAAQNQTIREMLEQTLTTLEKNTVYNDDFLRLVEEAGATVPELKFSVLEIDPDDPQESVLMAMLTRISPDAETHSGPIVVPFFGQGRAAVLMMNEYIAGPYIESVVKFLTGACSCEVKALNPGFDILIPVDWIGGITREYVFDAQLPPLSSPSAVLESDPEPAADPLDQRLEEPEKPETRLFNIVLGVFVIAVLGGLGTVSWLLLRKQNHHESF